MLKYIMIWRHVLKKLNEIANYDDIVREECVALRCKQDTCNAVNLDMGLLKLHKLLNSKGKSYIVNGIH